jgi:hypothetical protein
MSQLIKKLHENMEVCAFNQKVIIGGFLITTLALGGYVGYKVYKKLNSGHKEQVKSERYDINYKNSIDTFFR